MKHALTITFLFLALLAGAQTIVSDTAYVKDTTISGVKYFQEVQQVTYDNGASQTNVGQRLDSAEFVRRAFVSAHDAVLPLAEGVRLLANPQSVTLNNGAPAGRPTHLYYSGILESVTGSSYQDMALDTTSGRSYIQDYHDNVWRVFYDSAGVAKDFFVYYIPANNVGREITNPSQVINDTEAPAFVPGTQDRRIRFFPYTGFFARATLLVRDGGGSLIPFFTPLKEVRSLRTIVDDEGVDTGRTLFGDSELELRLVRIPIQNQQQ